MAFWTWKELETMWQHPDWTSEELHEIIPRHTAAAIKLQRHRSGRWKRGAPLCCMCEERPVWMESPAAKRYGLCKGCYLDEERLRLEESAKQDAVKARRARVRRRNDLRG